MPALNETGARRASLAALLRSYVEDLRGWVAMGAVRYGIAVALLAGGVLSIFAAFAVGATALFRFIALRYGEDVAFAAIGGGLGVAGLILLLAGWAAFRRRLPPLPRPHRQARAARQMLIGSAALGAVSRLSGSRLIRADAATQALAAAAALLLAGWIVVSRMRSRARNDRVRP